MVRTLSDVKEAAASQTTKPTKKGKGKQKPNDAACSSQALASQPGTPAREGEPGAEGKPKIVRLRPGMRALREIREYQGCTELLLQKTRFQRLTRQIATKINPLLRFEVQALLALHEAAEMFMVGHFEDASLCCAHGRRVTVMERDLILSKRLRTKMSNGSQNTAAVSGGRASVAGAAAPHAKRAKPEKKEAVPEEPAPATGKPSESPAGQTESAAALPVPATVPLSLMPPTDITMAETAPAAEVGELDTKLRSCAAALTGAAREALREIEGARTAVAAAREATAAETQAVPSTVQDDDDEDEDDEDYEPEGEEDDQEEGEEEEGEEENEEKGDDEDV